MKHSPALVMKTGASEMKRILLHWLRFGRDDYRLTEDVVFWTVVVLLVLSLGASAAWEVKDW